MIYLCDCGNRLEMSFYEEALYYAMPKKELPYDQIIRVRYPWRSKFDSWRICDVCRKSFRGRRDYHDKKCKV